MEHDLLKLRILKSAIRGAKRYMDRINMMKIQDSKHIAQIVLFINVMKKFDALLDVINKIIETGNISEKDIFLISDLIKKLKNIKNMKIDESAYIDVKVMHQYCVSSHKTLQSIDLCKFITNTAVRFI